MISDLNIYMEDYFNRLKAAQDDNSNNSDNGDSELFNVLNIMDNYWYCYSPQQLNHESFICGSCGYCSFCCE